MANTDNEEPVISESFPKETHASNSISQGPALTEDSPSIQDVSASKSLVNPSPEPPAGEPSSSKEFLSAKVTAGPNGDASSALNSLRPNLAPLPSNGTTAAPHPKRFSAVNISKKFLEKNSLPAPNSMASSSSSQAKSGGSAARPSVQSSYPHSRLVTAKLTAAPQPSTTTGPGWSRPSSVAPGLQPTPTPNGIATQSSSSSQPKGPATSAPGPPQLPHAGMVIQPQPRAATQISQTDGMTSGKSVWGNLRSSNSLPSGVRVQSEFPTAAEVAQVSRKAKGMDGKESTEVSEAHKQARLEEADTFRGVHLDPNAHHWDEMEEDDDNFLDGVIEFGDGRQYKVDTAETPPTNPPTPSLNGSREPSRTSPRREREASIGRSNFSVRKEERFADDFDRSWPKSSSLSSVGAPYSGPSGGSIVSPTSPGSTVHVSQSGQESGRVLFNERSNRLEPYSSSHRQGQTSYPLKKVHSDAPVLETKTSREASSSSNSNVQLLQKGGERGRAHMGIPGSGTFDRQRDYSRRDGSWMGHVPPSPRSAFSQAGSVNGSEIRGRRLSNMGPPPPPGSGSRDFGQRQSTPHYPIHSYNASQAGMPSRESRFPPGPPSSSSAASVRHPSQSPVLSHASSAVVSSGVEPSAAQLTGPDIDELRKDVMQSAAARAKQRRQQEEEEREKEKERARRKAAELANEAKPKTDSEAIKEHEIIAVIEDAIKSVDIAALSVDSTKPSASEKTPMQRLPSLKGLDRTRLPVSRRLSMSSSISGPAPAALTASWRSHVTPLPPPSMLLPATTSRNAQTVQTHGPSFVSALEHVQILAEDSEADLEVIEFSDMGKFVGLPDPLEPKSDPSRLPLSKPSRPVASDFFDDRPGDFETPSSSKADMDTWRRRGSLEGKGGKDAAGASTHPSLSTPSPMQQTHLAPSEMASSTQSVSAQTSPSKSSKYQCYNQATMSALDDAMSRIKGALDVMQASDKDVSVQLQLEQEPEAEPKRPSPPAQPISPSDSKTAKERWIPPALRPRHLDVEPRENFHSTAPEPPRSPKPAWNAFTVKLPKTSIVREAISKKQLSHLARVFPVRWDILSFDPPVEGMSRRDFTVIDVLYRKQPTYKGKNKFRVVLPRAGAHLQMSKESNHLGSKGNGGGAFGKPTMADGASTWRKPESSPLPTNALPGPPSSIVVPSESPLANSSSLAPSVKGDVSRIKPQPKMPAGTSVAFYRDSQVLDAGIDVKPLVNFIVTSELEEPRLPTKDGSMAGASRALNDSRPDGVANASIEQHIPRTDTTPASSSSLIQTGNTPDDLSDLSSIAPPSQPSSSWSRSSLNMSGRGPDPEHLKAVWSQTSNMAELHPVNSLEGIADDPVPFTLQDVKSEDGATPPPTSSSGPSRMSLHDVTRAFQQVPPTSGSTNHKLTISPPTTSAPVARPAPNFGYAMSLPTSNQNMRAPYPPYGSPMMSHSPAPVVYSHPITNSPVPSRMQVSGQTPLYGQPAVWMPLPAPATTQAHGAMMRPVPSPYPPQLMAYSPSAQPMYLPVVPNMQSPPQQNSASNRGRSMSMMMSPGIPHASPNMYGSPVMMASPARNQMRNDNSQTHPPPTHHPPTSTYAPVPSTSFMRPSW
ncbi:uncharacterized protein BT62DRAFT_1072351 [Guyanagaster necrorhizus]|uniref:Uncharacterized protein n=1 Tax=Guyanagaster necrorhizus TaxID=856835 RepID=A0A9P8AXS8_9AGAR|nr:uncharacterized protein BT62DRAFT_1072351 [Guyanagaster necrorhizus MCA 3950]KAG7450247.1 hypothetical protein BT62DRAFT_1072351 [Guyanagaster necrorhizus MCA 3950]